MNKLTAIVLCGGESRRMGTDKGLIAIGSTNWAVHLATKLDYLALPFLVSVNASQVRSYRRYFDDSQLVTDRLATGGPLRGILSAHARVPGDDLLVLACDMIDMHLTTLSTLTGAYRHEPGFDHYVFQNGAFAEPLCGIYSSGALATLSSELAHTGESVGLQSILKNGNTKRLTATDPDSFRNYNTPGMVSTSLCWPCRSSSSEWRKGSIAIQRLRMLGQQPQEITYG